MNEQQAQEMIHYLSTLTNYAMLMNDQLERLLEVAEANKSFKTSHEWHSPGGPGLPQAGEGITPTKER
jgi:hypothetical protein